MKTPYPSNHKIKLPPLKNFHRTPHKAKTENHKLNYSGDQNQGAEKLKREISKSKIHHMSLLDSNYKIQNPPVITTPDIQGCASNHMKNMFY